MKLYLIRHGVAEDRDASGTLDGASRRLTREGVKKMQCHAAFLSRIGVALDEIWTSPLVRARQTADLLAAALPAPVRVVDALRPGGNVNDLWTQLATHAAAHGIAWVGHQPDLGETASVLLAGMRSAAISFKKGGAACFDIDDFSRPVRGTLLWLLTPRVMGAAE